MDYKKKQRDRGKKTKGVLARKMTVISVSHAMVLGILVMLISLVLFLFGSLSISYRETASMARVISRVLEENADVNGLVDAVLKQMREDQGSFRERLEKHDPAQTEGQLLNYRWYTEENPPLAKREDYQKVFDTLLLFNQNYESLNGTSLMVFDKKTHTASLLCDVEKFGGEESVPVQEILWRNFEEEELDLIEEERGSLLKNLQKYQKIDPRYFVFAWYEPYPYPDDEVVVFIEADSFYTNIWKGVFAYIASFSLLIFAIVLVLGLLFRKRISKTVVNPVNAVSGAAEAFARDRRNGERDELYFAELSLHTGDELENLASTMKEMEKEIGAYEENLTRATAERERIAADLDVAGRIQLDMLPKDFPLFPDRKEFEVYASMDPAKEVGGDFYDIFLLDEDHLCLVMADVSGKGVPAALFMVSAITALRNRAALRGTPSEILSDVNESLCVKRTEEMFVTVWLGILTISTGELVESNAGHEDPAIGGSDGGFEIVHHPHGFVLGGLKDMTYDDDTIALKRGDCLFIYTDGVLEAVNEKGERFGKERMLSALEEAAGKGPEELLARVRLRVDEFAGAAPQFDDLTMLALKYNGG